jgi:heme ABC exporter ATP-binding subunit CcmA
VGRHEQKSVAPPTVFTVNLVVATQVAKRFSTKAVLRGLDFDLRPGEVLSVTGPNGTGKSTLLRVLAGTLLPDTGQVLIRGQDSSTKAARALVATSYNDDRSWYGRLSSWENLRFWQSLRGHWPGDAEAHLEALGLGSVRDTPVAVLSSGQRARLGVVRALAAATPVIILDEPTRGVDTAAGDAVSDAISAAAAAGKAVVLATHDDRLRDAVGGRRLSLTFGDAA